MSKFNPDDFISKACVVHNFKYTYKELGDISKDYKVLITCPLHGNFKQNFYTHLKGSGCPECKKISIGTKLVKRFEDVITQFKAVHGDVYDYSRVIYVNDKVKIAVNCKLHGEFQISPNNHKRGKGCSACAKYGYRRNLPGTFYILTFDNMTKVGITNNKVIDRVKRINKSSGNIFTILEAHYFNDGNIARNLEIYLLNFLRNNYSGVKEIFSGSTETFINVDLDVLRQELTNQLILTNPTKHIRK